MSNPHMLKLAAVTLLPVAFTAAGLSSGQAADGKPLSIIEVAERLENAGYGPFTELSMDDGLWEVEARKQNESLEVKVDPLTGNIVSEYRDDPEITPPTGSMSLPALLRAVQATASTSTSTKCRSSGDTGRSNSITRGCSVNCKLTR